MSFDAIIGPEGPLSLTTPQDRNPTVREADQLQADLTTRLEAAEKAAEFHRSQLQNCTTVIVACRAGLQAIDAELNPPKQNAAAPNGGY